MNLNRGTNLDHFLHIAGKNNKKHQDIYFIPVVSGKLQGDSSLRSE
jgi:hypothetical protein